jgi:hypothetical protein
VQLEIIDLNNDLVNKLVSLGMLFLVCRHCCEAKVMKSLIISKLSRESDSNLPLNNCVLSKVMYGLSMKAYDHLISLEIRRYANMKVSLFSLATVELYSKTRDARPRK